ncbi:MAG: YHS domain-containing protein [bacterium]|nr:YHS domain-containing protein [bacterium]
MYFLFRLLKILLVVGLIYYLYKVLWKGEPFFKSKKKHPQKAIEEIKKDPVCGTYVPVKHAFKHSSGKETYYFCSEECKEKFIQLGKERS